MTPSQFSSISTNKTIQLDSSANPGRYEGVEEAGGGWGQISGGKPDVYGKKARDLENTYAIKGES